MILRRKVDYSLNDINSLIFSMEKRFFSGVEAEYWKLFTLILAFKLLQPDLATGTISSNKAFSNQYAFFLSFFKTSHSFFKGGEHMS